MLLYAKVVLLGILRFPALHKSSSVWSKPQLQFPQLQQLEKMLSIGEISSGCIIVRLDDFMLAFLRAIAGQCKRQSVMRLWSYRIQLNKTRSRCSIIRCSCIQGWCQKLWGPKHWLFLAPSPDKVSCNYVIWGLSPAWVLLKKPLFCQPCLHPAQTYFKVLHNFCLSFSSQLWGPAGSSYWYAVRCIWTYIW